MSFWALGVDLDDDVVRVASCGANGIFNVHPLSSSVLRTAYRSARQRLLISDIPNRWSYCFVIDKAVLVKPEQELIRSQLEA
jgi:hypothetical protein